MILMFYGTAHRAQPLYARLAAGCNRKALETTGFRTRFACAWSGASGCEPTLFDIRHTAYYRLDRGGARCRM